MILFLHLFNLHFTPQLLKAIQVLFSPMVSGWAGRQCEQFCRGCMKETLSYRKLGTLVGVEHHVVTLI